jgi:hypothetical protein
MELDSMQRRAATSAAASVHSAHQMTLDGPRNSIQAESWPAVP